MSRPNLLLVISDQLHPAAIGALGDEGLCTPALDRLLREGSSFAASYCAYPLCSPARAAMITGRMPSETGVIGNNLRIRDDLPTMGESLRQAGYDTVYAGKWHVPACYTTDIRGFRVIGTGHQHQGTVSDPSVTESCVQWLHAHADDASPFCMVASYMQPHDICNWARHNQQQPAMPRYPELLGALPPAPANRHARPAPEPEQVGHHREHSELVRGAWDEQHLRYCRWSYQRYVETVDTELERLLQTLATVGRADGTVVVFTSDHGEALGHHGCTRKQILYDESARVPLIWRGPGIPRGVRDPDTPVSGVDIMPSFCALAGVAAPPRTAGVDLAPLLAGGSLAREAVVVETERRGRLVRSRRYAYIAYQGDPAEQLFDLAADPLQTRNLIAEPGMAEVLARHRALLRAHEAGLEVSPAVPAEERWSA